LREGGKEINAELQKKQRASYRERSNGTGEGKGR